MTTAATLRLLTMPECVAAQRGAPGPWRQAAAQALNTVWADKEMRCVLCDALLQRTASYAALIVPNDTAWVPQCYSGGVCLQCGVHRSRAEVHKAALCSAMMTMGDVGGHA